jgi:regulator of sigma E protease
VLLSPSTIQPVVIERDGERMTVEVDTGADPRYHLGSPGWSFFTDPPVIVEVVPDSRAEAAGLEAGDRILAVGEREPVTELEFREILATSPEVPVELKIDRAGRVETITVVPADEDGRGKIGVLPRPGSIIHRELTALEAAVESWKLNVELAATVGLTLKRMFRGDISVRALSGPIEIAQVSRRAVRGMQSLLSFLAFISLQLGILNLLPIPVLDGGHILLLGVEGVLRRDLSMRVKERVMQVGLVFLLGFFGVVIYFDVIKAFFTSS